MRNLKKILALVLALVMTMSVMATAAFTDAATIDTSYDEAAEVLAGLKVFVGRTDGSFDPKASITRAEVAAIIYRMVTGDVNNKSVNLYTEGADFTDTKGHWAEGYIGYCNNAGFIAGYGNGKFGPNDNVTGMQPWCCALSVMTLRTSSPAPTGTSMSPSTLRSWACSRT